MIYGLHGIKSAKGKSTFAQKARKKKKSSNLTTFKICSLDSRRYKE